MNEEKLRAEIERLRDGLQKIIDATAHVSRMNTLGMTLKEFCQKLLERPTT